MPDPAPPQSELRPLVPHAGAMSILHRVLRVDADSLDAEAELGPQDLFCIDGHIGGWMGIEYMAQAVAAWAGWQARQRGAPPPLGLLVGTRSYASAVDTLPFGLLRIQVVRQFMADNGLGQFDCALQDAHGQELARAALTVFEPPGGAAHLLRGGEAAP